MKPSVTPAPLALPIPTALVAPHPAGGWIVTLPDTAELLARADVLGNRCREAIIRTPTQYEDAADLVRTAKSIRQDLDAALDVALIPFRSITEAIRGEKRRQVEVVDQAEATIKSKLAAWSEAEEVRRREREAAARAKAEGEARAERDRQAAEARAAAAQAKRDGDRAGAAALSAEAKSIAAAPVVAEPVHVESRRPTVEGVAIRENWSAEVTDLAALVAYVAVHPEHLGLLKPDQAAVNRLARAMRDNLKIPGVKAVRETVVAAGAR